jgi:hypothetical protein
MFTYLLILVLNGTPTQITTPQPMTLEQCQETGKAWVAESSKLRGAAKGDFVCVPVKAEK